MVPLWITDQANRLLNDMCNDRVCFLTTCQGGRVRFPGKPDGGKWSQSDEKSAEDEKWGE